MVWGQGPTLFFCMWKSSYFNTICCWTDDFFPIEWSLCPCQKSTGHGCVDLFLDSVPVIGLYDHHLANSTLFWWLYTMFWSQEVPIKSSILGFLYKIVLVIWDPCNSVWILESISPCLWKGLLGLSWALHLFNLWTWDDFLFIEVLLGFFQQCFCSFRHISLVLPSLMHF